MVDPFYTYGPNVLRMASGVLTEADPVLSALGDVVSGQARQIIELQKALSDANARLVEHEMGAAHEPIVDPDSDEVVF